MIIDQATLDVFKDKYRVIDIESRCAMDLDREITMRLTRRGFERLIQDLHTSDKQTIDIRDVFAVSPIEITADKKCIYIAKFPFEKYPMDVVVASGKKLLDYLSAEGCTGIVLPDIFDVSILSVEQLTQIRDSLTEIIQNMNYDNIIGF